MKKRVLAEKEQVSRALWLVLACLVPLLGFTPNAWAAPGPEGIGIASRQDLKTALTRSLCQGQNPPTVQEAWQFGVYDAQVEGQTIKPKPGLRVTAQDLAKASRIIAERNNHFGATSEMCANGLGWIVTVPSPAAMQRVGNHTFVFSKAALSRHCRRIRIDYAAAFGGSPTRIHIPPNLRQEETLQLNTKLLPPGVISVTCTPVTPRWQGPVLWYLAPTGTGPAQEPPLVDLVKDPNASIESRLVQWVNGIRKMEKLPQVFDGHPQLNSLSRDLIKTDSVKHNRVQIRQAGEAVKELMGELVGENRVKAASLENMAWLLWNSPRHRDLILAPEATHIAVANKTIGKEELAVLVFAKF